MQVRSHTVILFGIQIQCALCTVQIWHPALNRTFMKSMTRDLLVRSFRRCCNASLPSGPPWSASSCGADMIGVCVSADAARARVSSADVAEEGSVVASPVASSNACRHPCFFGPSRFILDVRSKECSMQRPLSKTSYVYICRMLNLTCN